MNGSKMCKALYYENILDFKERTHSSLQPEEINLWNLCRTCLNDIGSNVIVDFAGNGGMTVLNLDGQILLAKDMLNETIGIEVTPGDRLPLKICRQCLGNMATFYLFKLQTRRSESVLIRMLAKLDENQATMEVVASSLSPKDITISAKECSSTCVGNKYEGILDEETEETDAEYCTEELTGLLETCERRKEMGNEEIGDCAEGHASIELPQEDDPKDHELQENSVIQSYPEEVREEDEYRELDTETYSLEIGAQVTFDDNGDIIETATENIQDLVDIQNTVNTKKIYKAQQRIRSLNSKSLLQSLQCPTCKMSFPLQRMLIRHVYDEHPTVKAFTCRVCAKSFTHLQSLSRHMQTHMSKRYKKVCSICEKAFLRADDWRRHLRTHTGERPYACDVCSKRFKQIAELKDHSNTHSRHRHYECSTCGHVLQSRNGLYIHRKVHEGARRHKCPKCEKGSLTNAELKSHLRTHLNIYTSSKLHDSRET